jgi:SAM-dependent methyltransferase
MPADDDPARDYEGRWRRLFAPRTGDLRTELAGEAATYLGLPVASVLTLFDGATERFAEEWRQRMPGAHDPAALTAFYNESQTEIFELLHWHAADPANQRSLVCADLATAHRRAGGLPAPRPGDRRDVPPRVLDYGAGVGSSGIVFAEAGFDVTLADVADPLLAFARWRFERRGLPVALVDLKRGRPPKGVFDAAICLDVLEHIPRPLPVVRRLRDSLRPGGLLFLCAPFGADPVRPMHVVYDDCVLDWFRAFGFRRRDDMEDWFPSYMWLAKPQVYERAPAAAWRRAAYFFHDVVLPRDAAGTLRAALSRVAHRRA